MTVRHFTRPALFVLIMLAIVGLAKPAAPQAAAPQPSAAAILLAKQIIEIKGVRKMFDPVAPGVIEKTKQMFMQTNFMWEKDIDQIAAMMHKEYDSRASELIDQTARIYASHFTENELKGILVFYQSPLGQKMIAEEPKALDESVSNAGRWGDNLSGTIIARMREEMKKRGHDM